MDESRRQPLADEAEFLADLAELDRSLGSPARAPLPAPSAQSPIVLQPGSKRPLLDLFPPSPTAPSPASARGGSPPPRLPEPPHDPVRAFVPVAAGPRSYEAFYGLSEQPFGLDADPRFLYSSTEHDRVVQQLHAVIGRRDGGIVVITGPAGIGKTMLCRAIVSQMDRRTVTSYVHDATRSIDDLLQTILADFGVLSREELAQRPGGGPDLTATLRSFAESLAALQASGLVLVDDAENVPAAVLAALDAAIEPVASTLRLVLVGQPPLERALNRPELRALHGRISARLELGPLAADEIASYVMHRLHVAGESPRVDFADEALRLLFEASAGVPRAVNQLADRALSHAFRASASVVVADLVEAAAADTGVAAAATPASDFVRVLGIGLMLIMLASMGAAAAAWIFQTRIDRALAAWAPPPEPPRAPPLRRPAPIAPVRPPE